MGLARGIVGVGVVTCWCSGIWDQNLNISADSSMQMLTREEYAQVGVVVLCLNHNRSVGHVVIEISPIPIGEGHNL